MRFSSNGNHRTDWGHHAEALSCVTYVRTDREKLVVRVAVVAWILIAIALIAAAAAQPDAMELCLSQDRTFDTCALTLR